MRISDWSSDVCSSDLEAGRKHHAPDAICPQRINGNGSGKSAVDAARQTQDDSGKAIAVHIIAEAKHHRAIDLFWVRIGYGARSEERRVGKESVRKCRSWWSRYHYKKNHSTDDNKYTRNSSNN